MYKERRRRFAARWITGTGLEIGALSTPFAVPAAATVRYVDHLSTNGLRRHYPELDGIDLVDVEVVDDGEHLQTVADASQDFAIASHVLEHCEDVAGTLQAHLRVLTPGGILLLALPDRHHGIDVRREPTTFAHVLDDFERGPETSRAAHYAEWVDRVDIPLGHATPASRDAHVARLAASGYRIHFHCWTLDEFCDQVQQLIARDLLPGAVVARQRNFHEFLVAIRRTG